MVNKIPDHLDNPIDNIIYSHIDKYLNLYKKIGLTPNLLTTISLLSGLTSVYLVHKDNYIIGSLFWFIAYYYDCADGKMARKFKMTSKFGDLYDHSSDIFKHILMFYVLYNKLHCKSKNIKYLLIIVLIVIFLLTLAQLGCQEKLTREMKETNIKSEIESETKIQIESETKIQTESPTLTITENFVFTDCKTQMKYTRYFGPATITLYLISVMIYLHKS